MSSAGDFEWNDHTFARLRELWAEGLSAAEIGRRLGTSKNSVVSKAHRLRLASRPSPIRRNEGAVPRQRKRVLRARAKTLPELPSAAPPIVLPASGGGLAPPKPAIPPKPKPIAPSAELALDPANSCCWPFGEPGEKSFSFCPNKRFGKRPYCPVHCEQAFVPDRKPLNVSGAV